MENNKHNTKWGIKPTGKKLIVDTTNGEYVKGAQIPHSYANLSLLKNDNQLGTLTVARFDKGRFEITYFGNDKKLEKVTFEDNKKPLYQESQFYKSGENNKNFELKKTKETPKILKTLEPLFSQLGKMVDENIEFRTIIKEKSISKEEYSHSLNGDKDENVITKIVGYTPEGNMYSTGRLHTKFSKGKDKMLGTSSTRFLGATYDAGKLVSKMGDKITKAYVGQKNGQEIFFQRIFNQPEQFKGLEHVVRENISRAMEAYTKRFNKNEFGGFNEQDQQLLH